LVASVVGLVITSQIGGAAMAWHFRCGYLVMSLLLFRVAWGLVGGYWSRFHNFIYSPATVLRYLRGERNPAESVGHSPLGALSVFAMLGFLAAQVATGLISDDEIDTSGPLARWVSSALVSSATFYHRKIGKVALLVLILTHIGAIAYYRFKKHDSLVAAMLHGDKPIDQPIPGSRDDRASRLGALGIYLLCALAVWAMLTIASAQP